MSCFPDKKAFLEKAKRGNLVPVWRELLADEETPVSAYERVRRAARARGVMPHSFLLESVEGGEHVARFSFIGGVPRAIFRATGRTVEIETPDGRRERLENVDPLDTLRAHMARYRAVPDPALPRFFGGAVGYIGYDAVAQFERVPLAGRPGLDWPDMIFAITDTLLIFDRVRHSVKVVSNAFIEGDHAAAYDAAVERINTLCGHLTEPMSRQLVDIRDEPPPVASRSNMRREDFLGAVARSKEYIRAGDIIQVVLSQRFSVDRPADALDVYRALRSINPSPYMYCLDYGDRSIVGSSPEIHVRCENGRAEIRPIAGTRPRAEDAAEDERLAKELLADPKERAEHIMLVDLARNDLGRACRYGSVKVPELMVIERYSHVMHIVSDVEGDLAAGHDIYDVFKASFPAGTVSGAPKIRAMEIIAELEPDRRGPYAGAIGYFSFNGNLDSCITIRTILLDPDHAHVQAGAGIVADSDPEREFEETQNKARGMLQALARAGLYAAARRKASAP
ncbi:MAG: anthranilate synthase component I [Verrucomicrobia bacterium]|nr:anthranilate synthase component I [Verrucomicrobiota bacterium]MBU1908436.1 anthranilate synthase component I [Verrucomicrobiota bacterium]